MAKLPTLTKAKETPRKQVSGTSYTASPAVDIPPVSYEEMGSSRITPVRDPVPELGNRNQELQTYKRMTRGDVSVRSSLRVGKSSILSAEFYTEPYSPNQDDLVIQEFVNDNIFNGGNLPWTKTLEGIVRFLENGFSVFEEVWELREWAPRISQTGANRKQYTMLRKLAERPARTISDFKYDENGGLVSIKQNAIGADGRAKEVEIPISKCVIFTFEGDGNIEGESILRPAYRNWFYKDKLYTIDAIQKERHGIGVPEVEVLPGATKKDKEFAEELGANLRTNEKAYIVRPSTLTVGFAELKGNPVDALESALHHDNQIMKNILTQFINLGIDGSGGGRATGATAFDAFMKAMKYIANMICDYLNMYTIPRLVAYNFPTNRFPKLNVRNIGETRDMQAWSAMVKNLMESLGITPDLPTEQYLRKIADMPQKTEARPDPVAPTDPTNPNDTPSKSTSKNGGAGNLPKSPNQADGA
jgi:hypothetical protein